MIGNLHPWLGLFVVGFPFVLAVMSFTFSVYISRRHLDAMVAALKGSRHIATGAAGLLPNGLFGRFLLIARISGAVTWPRGLILLGEMDAREVQAFPRHLKSMINLKLLLSVGALLWGSIVAVLLKMGPV
jgi:hypothetical protein